MYKYKNEHNCQQADDWLWDTIPNMRSILKLMVWSMPICWVLILRLRYGRVNYWLWSPGKNWMVSPARVISVRIRIVSWSASLLDLSLLNQLVHKLRKLRCGWAFTNKIVRTCTQCTNFLDWVRWNWRLSSI